jgi:hypothetical protein
MELSAVSIQHSAKDLFFLVFADSRQLMADRAHLKTAVLDGHQLILIARRRHEFTNELRHTFCEGYGCPVLEPGPNDLDTNRKA